MIRKAKFTTISLFVVMILIVLVSTFYAVPVPFVQAIWKNRDSRVVQRLELIQRMGDSIVFSKMLIGKTKSQVTEILGNPTSTNKFRDSALVYLLGTERGFMAIDSEWLCVETNELGEVISVEVKRD